MSGLAMVNTEEEPTSGFPDGLVVGAEVIAPPTQRIQSALSSGVQEGVVTLHRGVTQETSRRLRESRKELAEDQRSVTETRLTSENQETEIGGEATHRHQAGESEGATSRADSTLDNAPKPSRPGDRADAAAPFAVTQEGHGLRQVPGSGGSHWRRWWDGVRGGGEL